LPFIQQYDPAITLAIGTGKNVHNINDDSYEDWCLENGFEYVDMDTKKENIDGGYIYYD
jgi:hypothetical protein